MECDAVASYFCVIAVDGGPEISNLVVDVIEGLEAIGPRSRNLSRSHHRRTTARHRSHVQDERIGKARFDGWPIALIGRDKHPDDRILNRLSCRNVHTE